MKIILSYERTDQGLAERASTALSKALRGAEIFYDDWLVRQSDGALSRSGIRLSEYDCLFLLLSKASISSETDWGEWTKKVLSVARSDMRFIPVLLDECDTPECFLRMHYIDIFRIGEDAGFMQMVDIASSIDSLRDGVAVSDNIEALVRFTGGAGKIEIEVRPKITAELISSLAVILENEAESVVYSNELVTRSGKGIPIENDKGEKRFLYPLF